MANKSGGLSKAFVWIILALLILGLGGFGITSFTGTARTVATVGDQSVTTDAYARELQQEIRAVEAQTGQALPMQQARTLGLDRIALSRLVTRAALDQMTADLGISIGDENLQREILQIPAFQGLDGSFDRESYRFALNNAGLSEAEFEADLRGETARTLVQGAVLAGVEMPDAMTEALVDYIAARRSFVWATLDASALDAPLPNPTEEDLRGFYDDNGRLFTLPETKDITYALLSPEMILDTVEVDEAAVRTRYEERSAEFNQPERRLVERLIFPSDSSAADAMAQVEVGGTTFDQLVDDRDLTLADVDMGDVAIEDLGNAGEAIFTAEVNDVVGPIATDLGPAIFRINGVLTARETPFEEARPELREELARDRARRVIEQQSQDIDDLLAAGATIEELPRETEMELGQIDWSVEAFEGIAAYDGFRSAAAQASQNDFPEVMFLEDGSVFAMRVNAVLPARPQPFDDARPLVAARWEQQALQDALAARATALVAELAGSGDLAATGLDFTTEIAQTRGAFIDGVPGEFMTRVFEMEPGDIQVVAGDGLVTIVRLDETLPPSDTPDTVALRTGLAQELDQALAQDLFEAFALDAQNRARPQVDEAVINAVMASFQ